MQFHFKNFKKKFSAFKFSPKLWDKPARTTLGTFLSLWEQREQFCRQSIWKQRDI